MATASETPLPRDPLSTADGFLGSGLQAAPLLVVLSASTAVFLLFGGPLWSAPVGQSHAWRIITSYLLAVPAAAALLLHASRFTFARLGTSVGLIWSAKLIVTASLYSALAPSERYAPAPIRSATSGASTEEPPHYRAAERLGALSSIEGRILSRGHAAAGVAVFLESPPSGRALSEGADVHVPILAPGVPGSTSVATTRDRVLFDNPTPGLHTVLLKRNDQVLSNTPVPPGGQAPLPLLDEGVYTFSCAIHEGEKGLLVVVDHPYATQTDAEGRFVLGDVPRGTLRLLAVGPDGTSATADLTLGEARAQTSLELGSVP